MPLITKTRKNLTAEYLLSEQGSISRDGVTLAILTVALPSGQVLGKITASGLFKIRDTAAVDGSAVAAGILYAAAPISTVTQKAVMHARLCEVDSELLTGANASAITELAALKIIVR